MTQLLGNLHRDNMLAFGAERSVVTERFCSYFDNVARGLMKLHFRSSDFDQTFGEPQNSCSSATVNRHLVHAV